MWHGPEVLLRLLDIGIVPVGSWACMEGVSVCLRCALLVTSVLPSPRIQLGHINATKREFGYSTCGLLRTVVPQVRKSTWMLGNDHFLLAYGALRAVHSVA